jgi:uncharacterized membrane protein YgcG
MRTGRIRRNARRGLAAAVLGWLAVAAFAVFMAPNASAAPTATVEIKNFTPPVASVDKGGQVTFVNRIPAQNKGGINLGLASVSATVHTDVTVTFFGQKKTLATDQTAAWTFNDPATTGTITYTYRVVPQASLPLGVSAQQVINQVLASLPPLPAPIPYAVQTIAPDLPQLPSVNLPQLPQVNVPLPTLPGAPTPPETNLPAPGVPTPQQPGTPPAGAGPTPAGPAYQYDTSAGPRLSPADMAAAAAFDPSRYAAFSGGASGSSGALGSGGASSGSGGAPGGYDGASVPVFGQLAGLDGSNLEEESAEQVAGSDSGPAPALPAAALAAVVALAAVTAALVRTHQASRSR